MGITHLLARHCKQMRNIFFILTIPSWLVTQVFDQGLKPWKGLNSSKKSKYLSNFIIAAPLFDCLISSCHIS